MSAQRYAPGIAHDRMNEGRCPECGDRPETHSDDLRFWVPRRCDLLARGVVDRIEQFRSDRTPAAHSIPDPARVSGPNENGDA